MKPDEYKKRFVAQIIEKVDDGDLKPDALEEIATAEYDGFVETCGGKIDVTEDPEGDADECLSCWSE